MKNKIMKIYFMALMLIVYTGVVNAVVELDSVSFDPAIIVAGDEVDITLNFHDNVFSSSDISQNKKISFKLGGS